MSENGEWELVGVTTEILDRTKVQRSGNFPFLVFNLHLKRQSLFYVVHLLVPFVMLMIIGVLVFFMPSESGEKVRSVAKLRPRARLHFDQETSI